MNLAVTDAMQGLRPTPAFAPGHQMMTVGLRRRDHAVAQRARHGSALRRVQNPSSCRDGLSWGKALLVGHGAAGLLQTRADPDVCRRRSRPGG